MTRRILCALLCLPLLFGAAGAEETIESMTLREKVAQMFLTTVPEEGETRDWEPGGYILFADDFRDKTKEETTDAIAGLQKAANIPFLISVDEEGGTVNRVSQFAQYRDEPFLSPRALFEEGGYEKVASDTVEKSEFLLSLGINVNLGPVADVPENEDSFIYDRAFSTNAESVCAYVRIVVDAMHRCGIGCALKHFPGYGGNVDTHTDIAVDDRPLERFVDYDLTPFAAGIEENADAVLVSHNIVTCIDPDYPASLSVKTHAYLRDEMGFDGVVITDELGMAAITEFCDGDTAAVLAVKAGNDLLCVKDADTQLESVIEAVERGDIDEARIDESVRRILAWKRALGLME